MAPGSWLYKGRVFDRLRVSCVAHTFGLQNGQKERLVMFRSIKNRLAAFALLAFAAFLSASTTFAQSNIDGVVDSVEGYVTAGIAVGVSVLLFVLGRKVVRRLI